VSEEYERLSVSALSEGRLAWLLTTYHRELLERWKRRVLEDPEVPGANRLSVPALEDHIPELIRRLLMRLARHPTEGWGERVGREVAASTVGVEHAQQRFAVHYTVAEALRELSHFRASVLVLCAEYHVVPNLDESALLHTTIDEMMARSATELERSSLGVHEQAMAVVAHDLRNPLNTIAMYAARMQAGDAVSSPSKTGEILARSVRSMDRLVEDLLTFSKLEGGRFSIQAAQVDARDVAREVSEQYGPAARRRRIELSTAMPDEAVRLVCDHDRILQALGNLVGNAIKFTPEGGRVRVDLEAREGHCLFRVTDTGPGIAPEHVEDVFRPFWQAPGSRQGAGLGLAIARGIVEGHGGTIGVERHPPPGAHLVFTIPYEAVGASL
jgi:signal transduction histidine kinase